MSEAPDNHELARPVAVLEERMNMRQADCNSAFDRLRADVAIRDRLFLGILVSVLNGIGLIVARQYSPHS